MKTTNYQDTVCSIVERDTVATDNLRALHANQGLRITTPSGQITLDPVIYRNVADAITRLALVRHYKAGRLALSRVKARNAR